MGCGASLPAVAADGAASPPTASPADAHLLSTSTKRRIAAAAAAAAALEDPILSPTEIYDLCAAALRQLAADARVGSCPGVTAVKLTALALVESSGDPLARHRGVGLHGLWAVSLSTVLT